MPGLLQGFRVIDLTSVLSGPFASYQLGLMGAEVIKIEIPDSGDLARGMGSDQDLVAHAMGASFIAQNAGKKSLSLDLKHESGRGVLTRLIESADVLIENMRPGVLERLGFSWTTVHQTNPALVYCAITGFGQNGPLSTRSAYDQIIQGLAGMSDVTGTDLGGPTRVGFPICDTLGGYAAAMSICAALVRRGKEGIGSYLDVSMLETAITAMGWVVSDRLIAKKSPTRAGNHNATSSPSGTFNTGSGLLNIAANTQHQFESLCHSIGRHDLIDDDRFTNREDRKQNRDKLTFELESALHPRSAREWEEILSSANVPVGRVLSLDEALDQSQIVARHFIHNVATDIPDYPSVSIVGSGVQVNGETLSPMLPPPHLGQHNDELLATLGYDSSEIDELRRTAAI